MICPNCEKQFPPTPIKNASGTGLHERFCPVCRELSSCPECGGKNIFKRKCGDCWEKKLEGLVQDYKRYVGKVGESYETRTS